MFIKLTGRYNSTVVVRVDRIEVIDGVTVEGEDFTGVGLIGKEGHFAVKETPEQIMEMIEKQKVAVPTNGGYGSTGSSNPPHCGAGGRVKILNSSIGVNEK